MPRARPNLLARLLLAGLSVLLGACAGTTSDFDRIAPPMRFAQVRESASWVGGFDESWWPRIDAAYEAYDRSIDEELLSRWDAFCADASDERLRGQTPDARRARSMWSRHLEIDRALAQRERGFLDALGRSLPPEAEPFVGLLAARASLRRASGTLREPGQDLPGPLEVLQLVERRALAPDAVAAATAAYARLSAEAESAVRQRVAAYIETCAGMESILASQRAAELAERAAADDEARARAKSERERLDKEREARTAGWDGESRRIVERLRLALQREGRAFAQVLADPGPRSDYLDQLDFALHDGIRAARGIDAFARIARAAIIRSAAPGQATDEAIARLDSLVEQEIARQRTARIALSSGSPAARRRAYEELQKVGDPVGEFVGKALEANGGVWRVLERTPDVMAGAQSAEDAAASVIEPPPEPPEPPSGFVPPGRDRNLQLLFGSPLVPTALAALSARLGLSPDAQRALDALVGSESKSLEQSAAGNGPAVMDEFENLDPRRGDGAPRNNVSRFMGRLAGIVGRQRALDAAANERVLAEAARLAGVAPDDERIELTRLELDLYLEVGLDRETRQAEPIAGASAAAVANPFELARIAARSEGERASAEGVLLRRAEALRASHRALAAEIRRNLAGFLEVAIEMQSVPSAPDRWRPALAGREAVRLRLELVQELRLAIGEEFASRYESALRELVAPGCEPRPTPAVLALERLSREDGREAVAEIVDRAHARRDEALREFVAWRAQWVRIGDYDGGEAWSQLERTAPRGWLLRSRASDAADRALAASAALLDDSTAAEIGLGRLPVAMPRRMKPYFD